MATNLLSTNIITERFFFPKKYTTKKAFVFESEGIKLVCRFEKNRNAKKTIVIFHGSGETVLEYIDTHVPFFKTLGFNVFLFEYPGYGESGGSPDFIRTLKHVENIIKHLHENGFIISVFGRSIGSVFAIHAAWKYPFIKHLIIEGGISDFKLKLRLTLGDDKLIDYDKIDKEVDLYINNINKISQISAKKLIMHSKNDTLVGVYNAEDLYNNAKEPKQIKFFDIGNHNTFIFFHEIEYLETLDDFLTN